MGLYQKIRPTKWDEVIGQDHVVNPLRKMVEDEQLPSLLLLGGPSGVGKTTIARIIRDAMVTTPQLNFIEINAGTDGGIDKVRSIKDSSNSLPLASKYKIWLIDEAHKLSTAAQNGFLKETEDAYDHIKYIFLSSEPDGLIRAIQTRATRFDLKPIGRDDIAELIRTAMASEEIDISAEVISEIALNCEGSARQALVMLEQASAAKTDEEAMEIVQRASTNKESYNFCQILLTGGWKEAVKAIQASEKEAESMRRGVMGYMSQGLISGWLKGHKELQAIKAMRKFQFLMINGKPDLVLATWEFFHQK